MLLEGRNVLVTGAGRGIGRAIAFAAAREGARVGIHYRNSEEGARALAAEFAEQALPEPLLVHFDVRDSGAVEEGIAGFAERAGGLDGLVNNAGVSRPDLLVAASEERIRELIEVNLLGAIFCARAALPKMLLGRRGVVVNVGSVAAARPTRGQAVYAATKGALDAFTRALAWSTAERGSEPIASVRGRSRLG